MAEKKRRRRKVPEPRQLPVSPIGHQPSKAELEETVDMPGMTRAELRRAFFRPFDFKREK